MPFSAQANMCAVSRVCTHTASGWGLPTSLASPAAMIRSASIAASSHCMSAASAPSAGNRRRRSSSAPARMFASGRRPDSQP
ncbi:hypothetical protein GCM10010339_94220 [Streptomyces alanosinicus]|uniref:Uncharacterized protein n=1 Tax=Streptomyces alanosinicus TaxID=68171 RepID=A0A918MI80_9ACTN|nr:hypothetical protein GCM10010339_94220 [Streptomyces alanosinicus]